MTHATHSTTHYPTNPMPSLTPVMPVVVTCFPLSKVCTQFTLVIMLWSKHLVLIQRGRYLE